MYRFFVEEVKIHIPFSDFQCSVLRSQLRPNGWAFEIFCVYLQKIFCFFRAGHKGKIDNDERPGEPQ